jgi:hypothetical protein
MCYAPKANRYLPIIINDFEQVGTMVAAIAEPTYVPDLG